MKEKTPSWSLLYSMSQDELKVIKRYLEKNLSKGFIRISSSFVASPMLFACKPGGGLWFCINYWQLNTITIKNRYFLRLTKKTLEYICKAKIYSKINIIVVVKGRPRGKSADHQSLLPRAQRDAQREWMKLRFGCMQIVQGQTGQG